jgi:hypothetical protein
MNAVTRPSKRTPEELEYLRNKNYTLEELEEIRDRVLANLARAVRAEKEGRLPINSQPN